MNSIKTVVLGFVLLGFSHLTLASTTNVVTCANASAYGSQDYGDAPASYGQACNKTDYWQRLGPKGDWSADSINQAVGADNATDNGVKWRTRTPGGTWSAYSNTGTLTQGNDVEFQFTMTRATTGNHAYDLLKSWVDWNGNGSFANNSNETIINYIWDKNKDSAGNVTRYNSRTRPSWFINRKGYNWNRKLGHYNSLDTNGIFTVAMTVPLNAVLGDTWLRARVVCSNSLENHSDNMNLLPTGYQDQGETEDYKLSVVAKTTVKVPEPPTVVLFSLGLMVMLTKRKRSFKA